MKKASIAFLLAIGLSSPLFAQTDSLRREIGFSTQIILNNIFQSTGAPFELMLKKKTGGDVWMRYGIGMFMNLNDNEVSGDYQDNSKSSSAFVTPSIGLEKRLALGKKWKVNYGTDAIARIYHHEQISNSIDTNHLSQTTYYKNELTENSLSANLRPFLGLIFSPINRLLISTEASAILGATFQKRRSERYENEILESEGDAANKHYHFSLRPASAIYIYYSF